MLTRYRSTKWLYKFLIIGVISGYVLLIYGYYKHYLSLNMFIPVSVAAVLYTSALVLLLKPIYRKKDLSKINLSKFVYILPYIIFLCALAEIQYYGHLGILTVIALITIFITLPFSNSSTSATLIAVLSLAEIISVLYSAYTPSFGNDAWRDTAQATQIIERGGLRDLTILHSAYPFPVVSLLYAIHSTMTGLSTLWSSSVIGLLYLLLLALWIHILASRVNTEHSHIATVLALTTPLIVIWSVAFIPQAYSLLMALPLIFLNLNPAIIIILSIALALGHGGMALWALLILTLLTLSKRIFGSRSRVINMIEVKLVITLLPFIPVAIFTPLSMGLSGGLSAIINTLLIFPRGENVAATSASVSLQPSAILVLGIIPVTVLATLGLVALLESEDVAMRILALISLAGLVVGYAGAVVFPVAELERYAGLPSAVILAIVSPQAMQVLTRRGCGGTIYALSLILLSIASFGFAGTLMPENPYTANLHTPWSITGLVNYSESAQLDSMSSFLGPGLYLTDWRTGTYLFYRYLWIEPLYRGFKYDGIEFLYGGSYRFYVTSAYLQDFKGYLLLRLKALDIRVYEPGILNIIATNNDAILYNSGNIILYIMD